MKDAPSVAGSTESLPVILEILHIISCKLTCYNPEQITVDTQDRQQHLFLVCMIKSMSKDLR